MQAVDLSSYTRWITASILKHIDDKRQGILLYVEGKTRKTQDAQRWLEARIDGPMQRPCATYGEWVFDLEVNILCSVLFRDRNIYDIQVVLGIASQALNTDIPVFKYGDMQGDSPTTYVGCLQLEGKREGVHAHSFGQIEEATKIIQGVVSAHYCLVL